MAKFSGGHGALVCTSQALIERSRVAISRSLDRIVWMRDVVGEHAAARAAVASFVDIAQSCGLSAAETLVVLRDIVQKAQHEAGDRQSGGALEQAVMRWGSAACGR